MMRKMTLLLPLVLALPASGQAPAKPPAGRTSGAAQALIALEHKWVAALEKADTATLDSILSDSYVDTSEDGQRADKQSVLSVMKSGDLKFESVKAEDMQVHTYGDAAVVTGTGVQRGTFQGQPIISRILFTDTFVQERGNWRAVASHRCAAPGASGARH